MTEHHSESDQVDRRQYLRLVLFGAVIGVPAALAAALFLATIHEVEHWLWTDLPDALGGSEPQWYLVLMLPVVGAAIVVAARLFLPGDGGHKPLEGISLAPTPIAHAPGVILAAIGTLGFGAVLGPEGPVIALGSIVALAVTPALRIGMKETRILSAAGSFASISALFGGPLVGGVMLVEAGVGLGAALIPTLLPGFVAAAVGYVIFTGFGDWGGLNAPGLVVPNLPAYEGVELIDFFLSPVIGVATALTVLAVRRLATRIAGGPERRLGMPTLLLGGGLAVGGLALAARGLGADSQDVLFSGQFSISTLVQEDSLKIVIVLLVAKALAYAVSLGCGFRGGPIFPAAFLGIGIATVPVVLFDTSPTFAIAAGTAAGMAAQSRLVVTSMLFAALLVGSGGLDAVPSAVLAAVAAWLTVTALDPRPTPMENPGPASSAT